MQIRMKQTRNGTIFEALCDLCGKPISLSENCTYLTRRHISGPHVNKGPATDQAKAKHVGGTQPPVADDDLVSHAECARSRSTPGYWMQLHRVRWLLEQL